MFRSRGRGTYSCGSDGGGTLSDGDDAAAGSRSPHGADPPASMTAGGGALLAHHGRGLSSDTDAPAVVVGAA